MFQQTEPGTMLQTLTHLNQRYGGAERYLRDGGLDSDDVTLLRHRLTTRPNGQPIVNPKQ